jgi:hypothetical protein
MMGKKEECGACTSHAFVTGHFLALLLKTKEGRKREGENLGFGLCCLCDAQCTHVCDYLHNKYLK